MEKSVLKALECLPFPIKGRQITVALSGGADSMAMLYALLELSKDLKITVSAAHFNHMIRGEEAFRDEEFVKNACEKLGVKLFCGSADVPKFARLNKMSMELAARKLRYEFLENNAPDLIATAHTASDNLETVLLNLTRGTGLKGLCGIPSVRGRFIRPIHLCTRYTVEKYCTEKDIDFVTDSTNLCDDYTRNKLRHGAVPILKDLNASVENTVSRMTAVLSEDSDFIEGVADREYALRRNADGIDIKNFEKMHPAVAKRVIMRYYEEVMGDGADAFHINGIYSVCNENGRISLPQKMTGTASDGIFKIKKQENEGEKTCFKVEIRTSVNDLFTNGEKVNNLLLKNSLDCDKIIGQLVVRTRQSGDSIRLKSKNCTKTLKKLYTEYRIPLEKRENNPVVADDVGVVWINGIGVAERCATDALTKRVFKINVKEEKGTI